jgi:16S rRNA (adenine1518-N6/adenine1519-N6)-dimethyltransferase
LVIEGDALNVDLRTLDADALTIVANLPYNIGTALLFRWLDQLTLIDKMTLMFQREVAERLTAAPRSRHYGRLSVVTQWLCKIERLMNLPGKAFVPPPKVASSIVQVTPRPAPLAPASKRDLEKVVAAAFGQRRKMLRTSLKTLGGDPLPWLEVAKVAPTARAEEIDIEGFCRLANAFSTAQN